MSPSMLRPEGEMLPAVTWMDHLKTFHKDMMNCPSIQVRFPVIPTCQSYIPSPLQASSCLGSVWGTDVSRICRHYCQSLGGTAGPATNLLLDCIHLTAVHRINRISKVLQSEDFTYPKRHLLQTAASTPALECLLASTVKGSQVLEVILTQPAVQGCESVLGLFN